jgi:hypothetical protein
MSQLECPVCGKAASTPVRKLLADGVRAFPCRACGAALRLPASVGAIYGVVGIGLIALLWLGLPMMFRFAVLIPTLSALAWFQLSRVPFVRATHDVSLSQ